MSFLVMNSMEIQYFFLYLNEFCLFNYHPHLPPLAASNVANAVMNPKIFTFISLTSYLSQLFNPEY